MKKLVPLLIISLMATAACAGLDPATDSFGFYFDPAGYTNCTTAEAFEVVTAYLLLMNPAGPTHGFECTINLTGAPYFVLSTVFGSQCIVVDGPPSVFLVGCATDFPEPSPGAVVLMTLSILMQAPSELLFHIGPHPSPSLPGGLPVVAGDGVLRLGSVASGDVNLPVAGINAAMCPVSEDYNSFGDVKSLFR